MQAWVGACLSICECECDGVCDVLTGLALFRSQAQYIPHLCRAIEQPQLIDLLNDLQMIVVAHTAMLHMRL